MDFNPLLHEHLTLKQSTKQECIPIGCIPPASVAIVGGCVCLRGVCLEVGGVCLEGGCLPRGGGCLSRGGGVCLEVGMSAWGCVHRQGCLPGGCAWGVCA